MWIIKDFQVDILSILWLKGRNHREFPKGLPSAKQLKCE